jgi:hypothetical protein
VSSSITVHHATAQQAINLDIPKDLPYSRVVERFFKVPDFLAQDYLVRFSLPVSALTVIS